MVLSRRNRLENYQSQHHANEIDNDRASNGIVNLHENEIEYVMEDIEKNHEDYLEDVRAPPQTKFNRMINLD